MSGSDVELARIDERLKQVENQTAEIKDLKEAIIKLTMIVDELKREKEDRINTTPTQKVSFWDTKAGEKAPLYLTILVCVLIAALVGTNLIEGFQATQTMKTEMQEKIK